jgi:phosphoglycolate phosphatase
MIEAIVIDLDDTLCMTEAASFELENETLKQIGRPTMSREVHLQTWGRPLFEAILTRSPGVDLEAFKTTYHPLIEEFTKSGKLDAIPEENYAALDKFIQLGKTIMVLTSRTHTEVRHLLEPDHLLGARIRTFYYRDNMQYHKPDPRAFDGLLKDTALQPAQCVYVGDSVGDAKAANEAGLHFIASLESGLRQMQDFDGIPVDAFVERFPDVVSVVASLDGSSATSTSK